MGYNCLRWHYPLLTDCCYPTWSIGCSEAPGPLTTILGCSISCHICLSPSLAHPIAILGAWSIIPPLPIHPPLPYPSPFSFHTPWASTTIVWSLVLTSSHSFMHPLNCWDFEVTICGSLMYQHGHSTISIKSMLDIALNLTKWYLPLLNCPCTVSNCIPGDQNHHHWFPIIHSTIHHPPSWFHTPTWWLWLQLNAAVTITCDLVL